MEIKQVELLKHNDKGIDDVIMATRGKIQLGTQLLLLDSPWLETLSKSPTESSRKSIKDHKTLTIKKMRQYTPYTTQGADSNAFNETPLLETPIWLRME